MKKRLSLAALCLIAVTGFAQQKLLSKEAEAFKNYTNKLEGDRRTATEAKNYLRADTLLKQWVRTYHALPDSTQKTFKGWESGMYYNIACYDALLGNKKDALTAFEKCVELGYNSYQNTIKDTDLESLHKEKRYLTVLQKMREKGDMNYRLQKSGPYNHALNKEMPLFTYQASTASELIGFKTKYNLDSVAGHNDEVSRMKNLLLWVHNTIRHDGNSSNPLQRNGTDLIEVCKKENRGVNCRMMATILKDAYQAEGFQSRVVTCRPMDTLDNDCHVITVVWSNTLNKWVWMDPTFNAYVTDAKGNLLNIEEVRTRLHAGKLEDLVLNDDANWNNKNKETKDEYLGYYMSKNLYWLQCASKSEWDLETAKPGKAPINYVNLYPGGYTTLKGTKKATGYSVQYATNNPEQFWQKPVATN